MKNVSALIFFLLGFISLLAQSDVRWSEAKPVSMAGDFSPVVGVLSDGTPLAIWGNNSKIFFSKMVDEEFIPAVEVPTGGISPSIYGFGGIDMAVYGDRIHIVFENFISGIHQIRSLDGGATFEDPVRVYDPPSDKWTTLPTIEIDDNGNPLVSVIFENTNETNGLYFLMRSTNGGESFLPPTVANDPADGNFVCECCPSGIFSRNENVWLVFRNNDNNLRDMWVTKSSDGGATFDEAVDVDATDWMLNSCPISGPKMAPLAGDSLLTIWASGASGNGRVYLSSFDGITMEKGFEQVLPWANDNVTQRNPNIAGANDTIGIVWEETGFGDNKTELRFAFSKNGTVGLLDNIINITNAVGSQTHPSLVYDQGFFHLIYKDGNGGLEYRRGLVLQSTAVTESSAEVLHIQVRQQPVTNGVIQLEYPGGKINEPLQVKLYDLAGNKIQSWANQYPNATGLVELKTKELSSAYYLLSVESGAGQWSGKVLLME